MRNLARSIPIGVALFLGVATAEADPPARVGRLSLVEGEVTVLDARDGQPEAATVNWPVTSGIAITTARGARAEVRVGSTAVRFDGTTDLEFAELDDEATLLRLREGTVNVRVRDRETAARLTLDTPQARVLLLEAGRYRFDANPRAGTATVTAFQGSAQVTVGGATVSVSSGKRAEIGRYGQLEIVGAFADGFDDWALARDRGDDLARSTRYVSPEMTGAESLDEHGDWRVTSDYGAVWYPRAVPVGWAPYRWGRWAWVEPWGWTWVDSAPWGFAPFHYGRWALIGGVWGWAPGVWVARPVFAPALVGWVGSPGWSVSVSIGAVPAVGWFPLAPRQVFVPAYRCSTVYVRNINVTHVTNVVHAPRPHFAHRDVDRAVTVVPASTVTHGHPVGRSFMRVRHEELAAGASNAPPATVAPPPRQPAADRSPRDHDRWVRRAQETPGDRPGDSPGFDRDEQGRRRERSEHRGEPRRDDRPADRVRAAGAPQPAASAGTAQPAAPATVPPPSAPAAVRAEPAAPRDRVTVTPPAMRPVSVPPSPQAGARTDPTPPAPRAEPRAPRDQTAVTPQPALVVSAPSSLRPTDRIAEPRPPVTRNEPLPQHRADRDRDHAGPRREAPRVEPPPRAVAPAPQQPVPPLAQVGSEPRATLVAPAVRAPAVSAPVAMPQLSRPQQQPQLRHEPRSPAPPAAVRAAAPPVAMPESLQPPVPREESRGRAREHRRGEPR